MHCYFALFSFVFLTLIRIDVDLRARARFGLKTFLILVFREYPFLLLIYMMLYNCYYITSLSVLFVVNISNSGFWSALRCQKLWWRTSWLQDKSLVAIGQCVSTLRILILCYHFCYILVSQALYVNLTVHPSFYCYATSHIR